MFRLVALFAFIGLLFSPAGVNLIVGGIEVVFNILGALLCALL